jgi:hypothetical protein
MGYQIYFKIAGKVDLDMLNMFAVSYSFWNKGQKVLKFRKNWWKKGNNSKIGKGIYFKIAGWVDPDKLHICAIKT